MDCAQSLALFLKENFLIEKTTEELIEFVKENQDKLIWLNSITHRLMLLATQITLTPPDEPIKGLLQQGIVLLESVDKNISNLTDSDISAALVKWNQQQLIKLRQLFENCV